MQLRYEELSFDAVAVKLVFNYVKKVAFIELSNAHLHAAGLLAFDGKGLTRNPYLGLWWRGRPYLGLKPITLQASSV